MRALAILPILLLILALLSSASAAVSSQVQLVRLLAPPVSAQSWRTELSLGPSSPHAPSPTHLDPTSATNYIVFRRRRRHYHHKGPHVASPAPATSTLDCGQACLEPLTSTPIGSPCGCVIPMKVKLRLSVAVYTFFPLVRELEIEVAAGTYLEQSQVQIVGAGSSPQDHEKTDVDVNLVPLGDKFDNNTATLTYERFVKKEVPLNRSLLGGYEVVSIVYPGIPSPLPSGNNIASDPVAGIGDGEYPISANVVDRNRRMNSKTVFIIVFSAVLMLLACVAAVYVFLKCWKLRTSSSAVRPAFASSIKRKSGTGSTVSSSNGCSTSTSPLTSVPTCALSVKNFTLAELEKATEKFSSRRILGEGGFGRVYYAILEDETEVAVKLLRDNPNGDREFISEVEMLSRLHHRNLVKLIGICIEGHRRCLVYELVHNGSVESHLHGVDRANGSLDWDSRMKIALGAARGLAYLHEDSNPRVIHRDFKASNVLLEDDFTPKVSDFGMAREAKEGSHVSTRVMGTFGYVAPEYAMTGHLLVKSDVYSYGVVLLELLSGRKPVDMSQPQGQENLVTWARPLLTTREGIEQLVDPALADGLDNFDDISKVAAIASTCVHPEVSHRPFMGEVVQALKLIYNDTTEAYGYDCNSQRDTSIQGSYSRSDLGPSERSWWNAGAMSPHLTYGQASPFITMEYSSGPLEETESRHQHSTSSLVAGERVALPINHGNRSGPLRLVRSKPSCFRLKGSVSEHGGLLPKRTWE